MLRRSIRCSALAVDINDWSRFQDKFKSKTVGKQFDSTALEEGVIPTRHLQASLFRLPIPKLEDTTKRYLAAVQPLVPPGQFEKTSKLVGDFVNGDGKALHEELLKYDKGRPSSSYISDDWFDLYLKDRVPLPLNYNPNLITRMDPDKQDGLTRAAFWIASSCRWYKMYRDNTLKPEVFWFGSPTHYCKKDWFQRLVALCPEAYSAKLMAVGSQFHAFPLDMSQYDNLFNSTRLPRQHRDDIIGYGFQPHIIVNYRGHQYKVTVANAAGDPLSESQIYARLKSIVDLNAAPPTTDIGILTSDHRDTWTATRTAMYQLPVNGASLETIDTALFVLNLDLETEADLMTSKGARKIGLDLLAKSSNRWWDKSFSVTVTKDGCLAVNFEHSWGDGVAILRYTVDCFNDSIGRKASSLNKSEAISEHVEQLKWEVPPLVARMAEKAKENLEKNIKRCDYYMMVCDAFGKSDKMFRGQVKPDPFMQVAMQLAWWRLNKSTVSTYESASTAAFKRGRTECIRSATLESQKFTLMFDNPKVSDDEKMKALISATDKHAAISKDAKMGNGIDRHLFALKKTAERTRRDIPPLFSDPSYTTFGSNMLSTSSLYSDALVGGGFGPVSPGYGIGYAAADDMMIFNITSWKTDGPQHSSEVFAAATYEALLDMQKLLANSSEGKK
jgi:carnitine O-palmitoyltransferase 2